MTSGHLKYKKGTQLLFYMAIARHTTESVGCITNCTVIANVDPFLSQATYMFDLFITVSFGTLSANNMH